MGWLHKKILRPLLFQRDSEKAHNAVVKQLAWVSRHAFTCGLVEKIYGAPALLTEVFGLKFPNPVGLAAGMDKHAAAVPGWAALGFGFTELGGVTWHAQDGNPKPRMFRAIADEAVINRMGFNNSGAEAVAQKLSAWKKSGRWPSHPIGINLGKSKITPLEKAAEDYANSFRVLRDLADFFVVNVSSPNTPGLRELQEKEPLKKLLSTIKSLNLAKEKPRPILLKIAPDLSMEQLADVVAILKETKTDGVIATNTTLSREGLNTPDVEVAKIGAGGLSGRPLWDKSIGVIAFLRNQLGRGYPIIGVGGIMTPEDAIAHLNAGADLLQVYTGFIYEGPSFVKRINKAILKKIGS